MLASEPKIELLPPIFARWSPRGAKQIAVLMSGGVDSSVSAALLKEDGWEVLGITMKIPVRRGIVPKNSRGCCGAEAAFVCNQLGIAHYFLDVTEAFEELIIKCFRQSYENGETPNPCVDCNTLLKFSLVWDFLQEKFGISYLATGHYARVIKNDSQVRLSRAVDKAKDQSYFLYGIARERIDKFVLPLGDFSKEQVRSIAKRLKLSVSEKAESMELCFAGEGDYRAALSGEGANRPGQITDMRGNKLSTHEGIGNYTIGQRRGVGFAGGKPLYVGKIDADTNTIALGSREEVSLRVVRAKQINVLVPEELKRERKLFGKIRSYGDFRLCRVVDVDETVMTAEFDEPQFAPCPGQRLVLYNKAGDVVAGGTIAAPANSR